MMLVFDFGQSSSIYAYFTYDDVVGVQHYLKSCRYADTVGQFQATLDDTHTAEMLLKKNWIHRFHLSDNSSLFDSLN